MAYEAGSAYLTILPSFKGGAGAIANQLNGPMRSAGQQGGSQFAAGMGQGPGKQGFMATGAKLGGFFAAAFAAVGLGQVVSSVKDYLTDAVSSASDLSETQSKVAQIFGESTEEVLEWGKTTADVIGQSQQVALDAAATFGIFGKAADLTGEDLAHFSTRFTHLASDLASFNNTSPEEAIQAIGAALRGESEPIRRYGVLLNEATLKARALELGLVSASVNEVEVRGRRLKLADATRALAEAQKEYGEDSDQAARAAQKVDEAQQALEKSVTGTIPALTQQQKILAAEGEILAQTSDAQGDFARTSDGLANSQRRLEAQLADVKAEIGTALLPVVTDLFKTFADVGVPILRDLAAWFTANQDEIAAFTLRAVDMGLGFVQVTLTMIRIWAQFQDAFVTIADNLVRFWFTVAQGILDGAAQAFGWIPGVGDKLRETQTRFRELRETTEGQLSQARASADRFTQGIRAGETAVGELRSAVQRIDGFTATVRIRAEVDQQLRNIPGTAQYIAAQARAHGGPVVAGRPYLVGERGPELVVPRSSGTVLTADQTRAAMGGVTVNVTADPRYAEQQANRIVTRLRDAKHGVAGIAAGVG